MNIDSIYRPVQSEMRKVEGRLEEVTKTAPSEMVEQLKHALRDGGKRVRPALTLLAGRFFNYNLSLLIPMATGVELLHTATLIHDDTIDDAQMRRGKQSIKERWGNTNAVLLGDYIFARSAGMVAETGNIRVIKLFAQTLMTICTGEIEESVNPLNESREIYYQTIGNKTASLFAAAGESGAVLSEAPEEAVQSLREYGYNLGMSFQIVDDILDFAGQKETLGKPTASDLARGILTLPVILLLEGPHSQQAQDALNEKKPAVVRELIEKHSILEECYGVAKEFSAKASNAIVDLPRNASYDSLVGLASYVTDRKL